MAMSNVSFERFDGDGADWENYFERFDLFKVAQEIAIEKAVPLLLSSTGRKTYELLKGLMAPAKPKEKTLAEINKILQNYFVPASEPLQNDLSSINGTKQKASP